MHIWYASLNSNEVGRRNSSVEEVANGVLPTGAIFKKAWMGVAYAVDPFCFGRLSRTEDLQGRAVKKLTISCEKIWRVGIVVDNVRIKIGC